MSDSASISISISPDQLTGFCENLLSGSSDITKTHEALLTLASFISEFSQPAQGARQFEQIEATLKSFTESSRQLVLEQYTIDLIAALKQCDAKALARVHTALSHTDFYQILQPAIRQLSDDDIRLVMIWSANWMKEAKQLGENISGSTDAIDFNLTAIRVEEFQAISDIDRVLNGQV